MNDQPITDQVKITVLKHLTHDRPADWVATATRLTEQQVIDIATVHGYPRTESMKRAIGILEKNVQDRADAEHDRPLATIPVEDRPKVARPTTPAASPPDTSWADDLEPATTPLTKPDEIRVLLNTAKDHPSKRVQAAGEKVLTAVDRLRDLIHEDEEKHAARRKADAEKAAARAEVERLEKQLANAKAKLRGPSTTTSSSSTDGPTPAEIRAWAAGEGLQCPKTGRVPRDIRDAYDSAHPDTTETDSDATSAA